MKKILVLGAACLSLLSCCTQKKTDSETDSKMASKNVMQEGRIEVLKQGDSGGRETAGNVVITTREELVKLYSERNWDDVPIIDFTKNNVVALFMGQKSSGGYRIGIEKLEINGNTAIVTVSKKSPEGMATTVMTQPYYIAAITKTDKVEFK